MTTSSIRLRLAEQQTAADGSFELAVAPRRGYLWRPGSQPSDYVLQELDSGLLFDGPAGRPAAVRPRLRRLRSEAGRRAKSQGREGRASAGRHRERPGRRAGRPAGPGCLDASAGSTSGRRCHRMVRTWSGDSARHRAQRPVRAARARSRVPRSRVYFLEPKRKLGATVRFSGKSAAAASRSIVKLEPCGTARRPAGRRRRQAGRAGFTQRVLISMVVTPGRTAQVAIPPTRHRFSADERFPAQDRPDQLREGAGARRPGPDRVPGSDPGRDLSHRRPHDHPRSTGPQAPQGIHRQARRDPRPGRYPDREAARGMTRARRNPSPLGRGWPKAG